jgi:hypothetical protein
MLQLTISNNHKANLTVWRFFLVATLFVTKISLESNLQLKKISITTQLVT